MPAYVVHTKRQKEIHAQTWLDLWIQQGYELECSIVPGVTQFIFSEKRMEENEESVFGCVEFIPYNSYSEINETFPFNRYTFLEGKKVCEVDKLAIKAEYQGNLRRFLEVLTYVFYYPIEQQYDYVVGFLNPDLYDKMIWRFKIPITRLVSTQIIHRNYIPVIFDVNKIRESEFGKMVVRRRKGEDAVSK